MKAGMDCPVRVHGLFIPNTGSLTGLTSIYNLLIKIDIDITIVNQLCLNLGWFFVGWVSAGAGESPALLREVL